MIFTIADTENFAAQIVFGVASLVSFTTILSATACCAWCKKSKKTKKPLEKDAEENEDVDMDRKQSKSWSVQTRSLKKAELKAEKKKKKKKEKEKPKKSTDPLKAEQPESVVAQPEDTETLATVNGPAGAGTTSQITSEADADFDSSAKDNSLPSSELKCTSLNLRTEKPQPTTTVTTTRRVDETTDSISQAEPSQNLKSLGLTSLKEERSTATMTATATPTTEWDSGDSTVTNE